MFPARAFFRIALILLLSACAAQQRADTAAAAKARMVGYSREQVLACMGPPKKKAAEGATEVWSYVSASGGSYAHVFCTVNVVMTNGVVQAVQYLSPGTGNALAPNERCGYAVANCVSPGLE